MRYRNTGHGDGRRAGAQQQTLTVRQAADDAPSTRSEQNKWIVRWMHSIYPVRMIEIAQETDTIPGGENLQRPARLVRESVLQPPSDHDAPGFRDDISPPDFYDDISPPAWQPSADSVPYGPSLSIEGEKHPRGRISLANWYIEGSTPALRNIREMRARPHGGI